MVKNQDSTLKTAERITRLKKFHVEALNLTFKIHITLNSQPVLKNILLKNYF